MARQQARRRNRERLTGIILACLGGVVLVVAVIALTSPGSNEQAASARSASAAPTASTPSPSTSVTSSSPASTAPSSVPGPSLSLGTSSPGSSSGAKRVPLVVLNNTRTNGLATEAANAFKAGGWKVSRIGNLSNEIVSTCAYYDPDVDGAEAAAKALRDQFPAIKRVVEKFSELPGGAVVVVLTSDYSAG